MHEYKQSRQAHSLTSIMYLGGILVAVGILGLATLIVSLVLSQQRILSAGSSDNSINARLDTMSNTVAAARITIAEIEKLV